MTAEKLLGQQFGSYYLEAILGSGGMAVVYRARTGGDKRVALKVLFPPPDAGPETLARFEREARTAARLEHPAIVRALDVGQAEGYAYLAMPLIPGVSLADRLARDGRLDEATAADIAWQIADALYYAHSQGVVHRDVKPSNILLADSGQALLTDFGVALALDDPALTRTGFTVGTPAYMAPEQASGGRPVDGRADLYALGVVLYQMVTGRTPFQGSTPQVLYAHMYTPPPAPSALTPISVEMEAVILRAMAKDTSRRFQTGAAMAQALTRLGERTGTHGVVPVAAPRRRPAGWWLALLLPLAALALWPLARQQLASPTPVSVSPTRSLRPTFTVTPVPPTSLPALVQAVSPTLTPPPSPSPTSTPSPTASATATVPATPVPSPSSTPLPMPASTPPPPSLAVATACSQPVEALLAPLLAGQAITDRLGCPRAGSITTPAARQSFERGLLLWRQDLNLIYVLGPDGAWFFTGDTWRDTIDPPYDETILPPDGFYQPVRGFGKAWREQPGVRDALGWATAEEAGQPATLQQFSGGLVWHNGENGELVVLLGDGTYERITPPGAKDAGRATA